MSDTSMGPNGSFRRTRRRPGQNREHILAAGIQAFAAKGYFGTSTSDVAALAGVSQPHIYASYKTKTELYLSCAEKVLVELNDVATEMPNTGQSCFILHLLCDLPNIDTELSSNVRSMLGDLLTTRFTRDQLAEVLATAAENFLTTDTEQIPSTQQ